MLDPATARLCVWRLPLEAAFRLFSKLGSLGGSIRERFSRTGRTRPALARPAFSRWLLENDRLRERWPCQWLNVLYFPFSETSPLRPFLCQHLGALPQTPASLAAPQGQAVKTQPPDPVAKCWVGSKASRVKCTASPPLTPLHLRESSKTIRSGRSWKPVKACEATACGLAFTGWRRPNVCVVRVQEVFPCTPATWRTRVWAAPTVLARPLGVAQ